MTSLLNIPMKALRLLTGANQDKYVPFDGSTKAKCLKPLKEHGQMDTLIKHLEAGGTATAQEIIHQCRTTNPTALITYTRKRLREDGKELVSKWETGGGKRWLRYSLAK